MDTEDTVQLRATLLRLAKNKEIPYTPAKLKKMSHVELEQVYNEHTANELDNLNETFADILIIKFDEILKNYKWIKPNSKLGEKLQDRKLFKNDVKTVVSYFTPLLPFLGLIEGGAVVVSEVMDASVDASVDASDNNNNKNNDDTTYTAEKGHQQNSTTTESDKHNVEKID